MTIVFSRKDAYIRVAIDVKGPALALYKQKVRNDMVRNALRRGGLFWKTFYLFKRFSMYTKDHLPYPIIGRRWSLQKAKKLGQVVPFMGLTPVASSSKMIAAATTRSRVSAIATGKKSAIVISVPYGHPIRPEFSAAFRTIPNQEIRDIGNEVFKGLTAELAGNPLNDENRKKATKPRAIGGKPGRNSYRGQRAATGTTRQRPSVGI